MSGSDPRTTPHAGALYGRDRELAELRTGLEDVLEGRGRFFLISGEPGIGKTRLVNEIAEIATPTGAKAFWGRCWEAGGAPAYWPWIQILRACLRSQDSATVESRMGLGASSIAGLVPELAPQVGQSEGAAPDADYQHARFYFFDAVSAFLKAMAEAHPLVLLIDDLHAADEASLLLLRFIVDELTESRILLIGAFRDVEARARGAAGDMLAELSGRATRLPLAGLGSDDVERFIGDALESPVPRSLLEEVVRATEGNPFFVDEIGRLLLTEDRIAAEGGVPLRIPPSVHETIRRRFATLRPHGHELLAAASVIGRDFNVAVLAQVVEESVDRCNEGLAEASSLGAVAPVPGVVGRYSFTHALVRETFYADTPRRRRATIHRQIGQALERTHAGDLEPHLAIVAHHFYQAASGGEPGPALRYAMLAGERATRLLAFEEAAAQFRRALEILAVEAAPSGTLHCDILLALGDAQRKASDIEAARDSHARAAELARNLGERETFARAALGYGAGLGGMGYVDRVDERHVALLEEALDRLGPEDSVLRVHCMARLAAELYYTDFLERRRSLSEQAVAMAARLGDVAARMEALHGRHWSLWGPDANLEEQRLGAIEILRLAGEAGDREMSFRGHQLRMSVELALGEIDSVDGEIEACATLAAELRQPVYLWQAAVFRAMRALYAGRVADAERLAQEALVLGQRGYELAAQSFFGAQVSNLYWMQGRLAQIEPIVASFVEQYPRIPAWRAGLAFLYGELGRVAEARGEFELLARDGFRVVPRDGTWLDTMYILALVCVFLGDAKNAAVLHEILEPYAGRVATISGGIVCLGPVAIATGALSTVLGRYDDAERELEAARRRADRDRAIPYATLARVHLAILHVARGREGDAERARVLVGEALATARAHGLDGLARKASAIAEGLPSGSSPSTAGADARQTFQLEGDFWSVVYDAKGFRLRDAKGLQYIHRLLSSPGEKFHVRDLAGSEAVDAEAVERLRKAVANGIRYAIARIEKESPTLARHLTNAIRTGSVCSYAPDRPQSWTC